MAEPQQVLAPYLAVHDAAAAIDFWTQAFGAHERFRMTGDDGRVGHAEIEINGATIMLADEHPAIGVVGPKALGGTPIALHLLVDDVDKVYEQAIAAGATSEREPADQFYGHRNATVFDPFGHRWFLSTPIEEVAPEEMARRAAEEGYRTSAAQS